MRCRNVAVTTAIVVVFPFPLSLSLSLSLRALVAESGASHPVTGSEFLPRAHALDDVVAVNAAD